MKIPRPFVKSVVAVGTLVALLLGVFALYTQPDFMVQMSNQLWACF